MTNLFVRAKAAMASILSVLKFSARTLPMRTLPAISAAAPDLPTIGGHFSSKRQRGKRRTVHHPARVNRSIQRAALKRRNVLRNRKAHKGPKC
jgi:hypothetical protein